MIKQAHVKIYGDVIGVGFRAWTKIQAKKLGVKGWVKNAEGPEGGAGRRVEWVEVLIQAEENILNKMIEALEQGSPVSRVDNIEVSPQEVTEALTSFEILR